MSNDDTFESSCSLISSSAFDASNPSIRKSEIQYVLDTVKEDVNARILLSSKIGNEIVHQCHSSSSCHRVLNIFTTAFAFQCKGMIEELNQEEGSWEALKREEINNLAKYICAVLVSWSTFSPNNEKKGKKFPTIPDLILSFHLRHTQRNENNSSVILLMMESFLHVLKQPPTLKNKGEYAPAISIIQCLITKFQNILIDFDANEWRKDLVELFAKRTLTGGKFASATEIKLSSYFLQTLTQKEFDDNIVSTLALKLRANPDSFIETTTEILTTLSNAGDKVNISMLSHLEGDSKLLASGIRLLRSPKAEMREYAILLMSNLALSSHNLDTLPSALNALSSSMSGSKAGMSFTTPVQREAAYKTFTSIAKKSREYLNSNLLEGFKEKDSCVESISSSLVNITTAIKKEASTSVSTKDAGMDALFSLLMLSFAMNQKSTEGCVAAYTYIAKPIVDAAAKSNSSTSLGSLFKYRIGSMIASVENDYLESIIAELFKIDAKIEKGLQEIVENSMKKFTTSSVVPQTEGLIAIYIQLVQCSLKSSISIPPSFTKLFCGDGKKSFLYSTNMLESVGTDDVITKILPQCIALFCKLVSKDESSQLTDKNTIFSKMFSVSTEACNDILEEKSTGAAQALAACIANPHPSSYNDAESIQASFLLQKSIKTAFTYIPESSMAADAIINALFVKVHQLSTLVEEESEKLNSTRANRESNENKVEYRGQLFCSNNRGCDSSSVRRITNQLKDYVSNACLGKFFVLLHVGSSSKITNGSMEKQRNGLYKEISNIINEKKTSGKVLNLEPIATFIVSCATKFDSGEIISLSIHEAALSLILTLGQLAGCFDPEYDDPDDEDLYAFSISRSLCVDYIAKDLSTRYKSTTTEIDTLTQYDIDLNRSQEGVLFRSESKDDTVKETDKAAKNADKKRAVKGKKQKGDFGAGFEEEEWERQVKKEIAAKKENQASSQAHILTPEEKTILKEQTQKRIGISNTLKDFDRLCKTVKSLVSDMEVGNACLPSLTKCVTISAVSNSPGFQLPSIKQYSFETLRALATCVFEIDEIFVNDLTRSIIICYRKNPKTESQPIDSNRSDKDEENNDIDLDVSPLPSPCSTAASIITEIDEYNDCLSYPSFTFIFPILRAALIGSRTTPGCETALTILNRHTSMIATEVVRREMAMTVLELLSHDRAQMFSDPSPIEALCACYNITQNDDSQEVQLSHAELAPLLGEQGALGGKNCRIGSMIALGSIASTQKKLIKNNPLIENRIWLNCFDANKEVKEAARKTWRSVNEIEGNDESKDNDYLAAPSQMYSIPLLPLLHHKNSVIANAAAAGFAHGMGKYPLTVEKNIMRICNSYVESFPTVFEEEKRLIPKAAPVKQTKVKKIVKKPTKSGGLKIGQATKPRKSKTAIVVPKPKARVVDKSVLESQFLSPAAKSDPEKDNPQKVKIRLGVLRVTTALTDESANISLDFSILKSLVGFLMIYGLADPDESVRSAARNAARDIVSKFGDTEEALGFLLPFFETVLNTGSVDESFLGGISVDKVLRNTLASDRRKEGAVVCLGSTAIHLKGEENLDKIDSTIDMLISTLRTPSEDVQSSVALCLSKLMKKGRTPGRIEEIISNLLKDCFTGETLAVRRGSSYGISSVVKGSGISSLKKYDIIKQLDEACRSGTSSAKEGALFTIELLSDRLGLLFEPYVIVLLPALLKAFSDSSDHVRMAAANTVDLIMSKLSAHGVKLVMPAVLTAFNEPAWRTKQASIQMLGSMSNCAPKQLANCLPKVVPKLTEAFSDTHPKVKTSAEDALKQICKVIKNPEISSISPILLKALIDPSNKTISALEALIETEFLHSIDSPSLALLIPVLHRGLRDRAAKTKRYGALISGNICTMINDPRDFIPYLSTLLPDLKAALLDPIPDVRSTASKALGSLTRGLGEDSFPDLRPWLIETLKEENGTPVERSGAAQGLTEVLIAGGATLVENVMRDEILPLRTHPKAATREGVLWILTFMPSSLGHAFTPLIDVSLPALIAGLSDDNEQIREVALRAGRVLIRSHGKAHVYKILPSLENGLMDDDYRIRVSSLTLLGDLLSLIGGTKIVKGDAETQDDLRQAERAQAQIALALGSDTRKRILSGVYFARSDMASVVRQSAVQVWKTVVSVTARTLREILDVLVGKVVKALASGHMEQTQVAGRCLGDVVTKLGDTVLPEIIPVLRDELVHGDQKTRRGACIGLTEVIDSSSKEQINKFLSILLKAVQDALCDEDEGVRKMAASCFQSLQSVAGSRASDEVVPALLAAMERDDGVSRHRALNGLTSILSIRSKELLPYLVHRLIQRPITKGHADALGTIATVTGGTIHPFFKTIIPSVLAELDLAHENDDDDDEDRIQSIRNCVRSIFNHVEASSVDWLVSEIASKCSNDKEGIRLECCWMIGAVVEERKDEGDFFEQVPTMYRELLYRLNDNSPDVLKAANKALMAISKNVAAEELVNHIEFCRNLIASIVSEARRRKGGVGDGEFLLPGLNMPKGLEPLLPMYQRGILYGDSNIREVSAAGLGELIKITSSKYLAGAFVIKLTGPLLRVVGDRNPSAVKIAIVQTLGLILTKGGVSLRAFVPQFQTTFVKALSDPSRQVRIEAIKALALLMPLSTRLDPLIKELVSGSLGGGTSASFDIGGAVAIQTATLDALACVLKNGGKKAKLPESIPSALDAGKELFSHEDEGVREGATKVIGAACGLLGVETSMEIVHELILDGSNNQSNNIKHSKACLCRYVFANSCSSEMDNETFTKVTKIIVNLMDDHHDRVKEAACVAVGALLGSVGETSDCLEKVKPSIVKNMKSNEDIEVHKSIAKGLCIAVSKNVDVFNGEKGLPIINGALKLAMSGTQKVQYAFNEFLWLVMQFDEDEGISRLNEYSNIASFENVKTMKTLSSKVLTRIKSVDVED